MVAALLILAVFLFDVSLFFELKLRNFSLEAVA
jgi:hypothetical protein